MPLFLRKVSYKVKEHEKQQQGKQRKGKEKRIRAWARAPARARKTARAAGEIAARGARERAILPISEINRHFG
jgi:hypothetical protein